MKTDIAITTVSLIRNKEERKVVLQTIENLSRLKIPIVMVDGGSPKEDKEFIRQLPNISFLEEEGGLTKQLFRSHYRAAAIANYLFYLHTDKLDFVKTEAKRMIDYYNNLKNKGVLIPTRTERSLKTYPPFQYTQEKFLNFFIKDYLGIKSDYYAGPKIYPSFLVKYLNQVKENIGWGIEAYFYVLAKRLGLPFDFIPVNFTAPKDIENEEQTKLYRLKIIKYQIDGLFQGVKARL